MRNTKLFNGKIEAKESRNNKCGWFKTGLEECFPPNEQKISIFAQNTHFLQTQSLPQFKENEIVELIPGITGEANSPISQAIGKKLTVQGYQNVKTNPRQINCRIEGKGFMLYTFTEDKLQKVFSPENN